MRYKHVVPFMGDKFYPKFDARGFVQKTGHFFMQKKHFEIKEKNK